MHRVRRNKIILLVLLSVFIGRVNAQIIDSEQGLKKNHFRLSLYPAQCKTKTQLINDFYLQYTTQKAVNAEQLDFGFANIFNAPLLRKYKSGITRINGEIDPGRGLKRFHFGFSLYGIQGKMKTLLADDFYLQDSVQQIITDGQPGFGFAGIFDIRLSNHFNLRIIPGLTLVERQLSYVVKGGTHKMKPIETTSFDVPLLLKYKSERIINTSVYVLGGIRYYHDFASDADVARGPKKKLIALKKDGLNYEFGLGLDIKFEYFNFCPEIKMSNSLLNMHSKDSYIYSNKLSGLYPRMFVISLNFETP